VKEAVVLHWDFYRLKTSETQQKPSVFAMSEIRPETNPSLRGALGVYVHVPFCASTCDFCAFYQVQPTAEKVEEFLAGVDREAQLIAGAGPASTLFWGGGTPGLLSPRALRQLGQSIRRHFGGAPAEWTVEMAPASVTDDRLAALREVGVTRISMGAQSFQSELLDALGRLHSREQIFRAYDRIRSAGFASVNLDLMFALPGQDESAWRADLRQALELAPDHLSTYCLTFEEDTAMWIKLSQGKVKLDPEHEARLYEMTWAELEQAGYGQYEISNFARPGHRCLHNVNTWRMQEWVGLGPSAASQHRGWRGTNTADLALWLASVDSGRRATDERTELTARLLLEDSLIFGLRMNEGVDLAALRARYPSGPWRSVDQISGRLVDEGLAELDSSQPTLRLTRRGRLLADRIGSEIMTALDGDAARS
jgi:oxygen-independent coproporphyrinogen-3 oxidase